MSVIGRGKGRGFTEVRETTLRRPGQPCPTKFCDLTDAINNLNIEDVSSVVDISDIIPIIVNSIKKSSIQEVFDHLYKQALEDRLFGIKLAIACSNKVLLSICVDDSSLRKLLLNKLQNNFEEREDIKKRSINEFRNTVTLFGEMYNTLRINDKPLNVLASPLLNYLEILLESSEEEDIEIATLQIFINGRKLHEVCPTELQNFLTLVRGVLINRNLSAKSRGMLLFIIDSANQYFVPLSGKLKDFYTNEIGINNFIDIQRHEKEKDLNVITKITDIDNYNSTPKPVPPSIDNITLRNSMKTSNQDVNLGLTENEKSPPSAGNERPMPRAIRGAGASDSFKDKNFKRPPRGKKDKVTDEQIWSVKQNTSSKVWGHDDRFDKDYD